MKEQPLLYIGDVFNSAIFLYLIRLV